MTLLVICTLCSIAAQDAVTISKLKITGHSHTKLSFIQSVLDIAKGDTLTVSNIGQRLEENKRRLLSTALFSQADANITEWDTDKKEIEISFLVKEGLHIYPSVVLEAADRNFNVWWKEYNLDINRINYGLGLSHINLLGLHDHLKLKAQRGYTTKYEISYDLPILYKNIGILGELFYANYHELPVATIDNKLVYEPSDELFYKIWYRRRGSLGINYRQDPFQNHVWKASYRYDNIASELADFHYDFYGRARHTQRMIDVEYTYRLDRRSYNFYPTHGKLLEIKLKQEGIGIYNDYTNSSFIINYEHYIPWAAKWTSAHTLSCRTLFYKKDIPYYNKRAIGYDDMTLRGYELYVIDGSDYALHRSSIRFHMIDKQVDWGSSMLIRSLKKMKTDVHLRLSIENGYVYDVDDRQENSFSNRLLTGGGLGIDVILYHTVGLSFEYNLNHTGEGRLYVKGSTNF